MSTFLIKHLIPILRQLMFNTFYILHHFEFQVFIYSLQCGMVWTENHFIGSILILISYQSIWFLRCHSGCSFGYLLSFHRVSHKALWWKISLFRTLSSSLQWIESFLSAHSIPVDLVSFRSPPKSINAVLPRVLLSLMHFLSVFGTDN